MHRVGRASASMNWVQIEFLGTQPTVLRGSATRIRYSFNPQMRGMVDKRDAGTMLALERGGQRLFAMAEAGTA